MNLKKMIVPVYKKYLNSVSRGYGFGKNPLVRGIVKKIESVLKSDFIEVQGCKMFLDKWDSLDLSINQVYNEFDTQTIKNQVKQGDIVLDVGAHIGYYTLMLAKSVGKEGKVFSFEPEPHNIEILKKNIAANNYQNIILESKGVSNINKKCKLYSGLSSSGASRIYKPERILAKYHKDPIDIQTVVLDEYFSKLDLVDKIDFVKMDIEGAEILALKGMKKILRESKNLKLFVEFSKDALQDSGSNPEDLLNILENEGFTIYYVHDIKNKIILADRNLLMTSENYKTKTINLLCRKEG